MIEAIILFILILVGVLYLAQVVGIILTYLLDEDARGDINSSDFIPFSWIWLKP